MGSDGGDVGGGGGVWTPNFGGISAIFGAFPSLSGSRFPFPAFPPQFWLLFPIPALFSPKKRPNSGSFYPLSSPPQPLAAVEEALSLAELRRTTPGLAELMPHPQASPASSVLAPPLFHPTPNQSTSLHLHKPRPFFKPRPLPYSPAFAPPTSLSPTPLFAPYSLSSAHFPKPRPFHKPRPIPSAPLPEAPPHSLSPASSPHFLMLQFHPQSPAPFISSAPLLSPASSTSQSKHYAPPLPKPRPLLQAPPPLCLQVLFPPLSPALS